MFSFILYTLILITGFAVKRRPCVSPIGFFSAFYSLAQVIYVLVASKKFIINLHLMANPSIVNKVKKTLDRMQNEEYMPNHMSNNFKLNRIMGIDLEILWSRYGRFQLLILSLLMSTICILFKYCILTLLSEYYSDSYNCTLIYPLAHNRVRPQDTKPIVKMMASVSEFINFLL